jgi:hypothetical protein
MDDAITGEAADEDDAVPNIVREVVGVFKTPAQLEAAVEQLGSAGIDRAAVSVFAAARPGPDEVNGPGDHPKPRSILEISDDPATPTAAFVSDVSWSEMHGLASAVPMFVGGFGAAWVVAAAGGALFVAIGATVVTGAVGAGLGALLYGVVARRHADSISEHLAEGGLIIWVRVADDAAEARALDVLRGCGAGLVHTHMIDRPWGVADVPLHGLQPDPFLEHDPSHG